MVELLELQRLESGNRVDYEVEEEHCAEQLLDQHRTYLDSDQCLRSVIEYHKGIIRGDALITRSVIRQLNVVELGFVLQKQLILDERGARERVRTTEGREFCRLALMAATLTQVYFDGTQGTTIEIEEQEGALRRSYVQDEADIFPALVAAEAKECRGAYKKLLKRYDDEEEDRRLSEEAELFERWALENQRDADIGEMWLSFATEANRLCDLLVWGVVKEHAAGSFEVEGVEEQEWGSLLDEMERLWAEVVASGALESSCCVSGQAVAEAEDEARVTVGEQHDEEIVGNGAEGHCGATGSDPEIADEMHNEPVSTVTPEEVRDYDENPHCLDATVENSDEKDNCVAETIPVAPHEEVQDALDENVVDDDDDSSYHSDAVDETCWADLEEVKREVDHTMMTAAC